MRKYETKIETTEAVNDAVNILGSIVFFDEINRTLETIKAEVAAYDENERTLNAVNEALGLN